MNRKIRKLVKELYGFRCKNCGFDRFLHVHHIDRNPENNDIENLVLLCIYCHIKEHPNNEEEMNEWALRKYGSDYLLNSR